MVKIPVLANKALSADLPAILVLHGQGKEIEIQKAANKILTCKRLQPPKQLWLRRPFYFDHKILQD